MWEVCVCVSLCGLGVNVKERMRHTFRLEFFAVGTLKRLLSPFEVLPKMLLKRGKVVRACLMHIRRR